MLKHLLLLSVFLSVNLNVNGMHIDDKLYAAAAKNRGQEVKELLKLDANPNHFNPYLKITALHAASSKGNLEIVEYLLDAGADCNLHTKDDNGSTPLMGAVYSGKLAVVQALLKKGALPNDSSNSGCTAMRYAASDNFIAIGLELLKYGASLEGTSIYWQDKLREAQSLMIKY